MARLLFITLLLMSILAVFVTAADDVQQKPSQHRPSDDLVDQIPDPTKAANKKKYKCSSCKALAKEAFTALDKLRRLRKGVEKYAEKVEALETLCASIGKNYGLLMRNNAPTHDFSNNAAISRLQGSWVNTYLESRCGELMEKYDEDLIREFNNVQSAVEAQTLICSTWEKSCSAKQALIEDL